MIPIHKAVIAWNEKTKKVAVLLHCQKTRRFCGPEMDRLGLNRDVGASSMQWDKAPAGYLCAEFMSIALELICIHSFNPIDVMNALRQVEEIEPVFSERRGIQDLDWRAL